ncbi:hypothetical protein TrST_g7547 [Triparma strigata]|uniref:4-hydroxybenzoate polyprenyltransferase n=1 Tax=Triparma strigata TaxID=1606541 RepID=A0A9W7E0C2_9STRA|nr:hypothetical protein TrST_g7547 [Triparma strigata]
MWDSDFDKNVQRTKNRPIASGRIKIKEATGFLAGQMTAGLGVLLSLPYTSFCFKLGAASLPFVFLYPTAKRWTKYPQLFLGVTFNWGVFMGWAANEGSVDLGVLMPMYVAGVCWTMIYDTIYAHQDKKDDEKLGLKSTALTFGEDKKVMYGCVGGFGGGLALSGMMVGMGLPYYAGVAGGLAHLLWQIRTADFDDVENLAYRFKSNQVVGGMITAGALAGAMC